MLMKLQFILSWDMVSKQTYCENEFKYLVTFVIEIRTLSV